MYAIMTFVFCFVWINPVFALYIRNQVNGSDNNVWRAEIVGPNSTVTAFRNDSTSGIPQPGGGASSTPAMGRFGNTLYIIGRAINNNGIFCNRFTPGTPSWTG